MSLSPSHSPTGNVEGYLKLLDRLRSAVDFFRNNNPSSLELSHVVSNYIYSVYIVYIVYRVYSVCVLCIVSLVCVMCIVCV